MFDLRIPSTGQTKFRNSEVRRLFRTN